LKQLSPELDRYRRLIVFAYAGDSQQPVQQTLLEQGRARALARVGNKACADLLFAAEHAARAAHLGLWADPNFAPLRPENPERIAAAWGQFALVEGKVLSVRESDATICLNFGRRPTHDFTAIILKRHRRVRHGCHRSETIERLSDPGAGLDRIASWPGDRSRDPGTNELVK
jgi:hypothetical protein